MSDGRRHTLAKWLKLAGLALIGVLSVSIPLTAAIMLSATGSSDLLTLGELKPAHRHVTPADAVARARCDPKRGYYALTFEDGPFAGTTPKLVAALEQADAVAVFFDVGEKAAADPQLVELQRSVGQVANHTYSHPLMTRVSSERRLQELEAGAKALDYPNAFVRTPFGEAGPLVLADIRKTGLAPVYWTVDVRDTELGVKEIAAQAERVGPGGIVRLHEGVANTVAAVPLIVARLKKQGMCPGFLAVSRQSVVSPQGVAFHVVAVKP